MKVYTLSHKNNNYQEVSSLLSYHGHLLAETVLNGIPATLFGQ